MRHTFRTLSFLLAGVLTLASQTPTDWQSVFPVDKRTLGVRGSNPYFILNVAGEVRAAVSGRRTGEIVAADLAGGWPGAGARIGAASGKIQSEALRMLPL
jgi:hypothetical protein